MKLETAIEAYHYNSNKAGETSRKLALVALVIVWIFKVDTPGGVVLPGALRSAAVMAVLSLGIDLLQYGLSAGVWGWIHRAKEIELGGNAEAEFEVDAWVNWPAICMFWAKLAAVLLAHAALLWHLLPVLWR